MPKAETKRFAISVITENSTPDYIYIHFLPYKINSKCCTKNTACKHFVHKLCWNYIKKKYNM